MTNKNLFVLTFAIFLFVASVLIVSPGTVTGFLTNQVSFQPAGGLQLCSSVVCDDTDATMNVYWHLDLPSGLHSDTYTDNIEVMVIY